MRLKVNNMLKKEQKDIQTIIFNNKIPVQVMKQRRNVMGSSLHPGINWDFCEKILFMY